MYLSMLKLKRYMKKILGNQMIWYKSLSNLLFNHFFDFYFNIMHLDLKIKNIYEDIILLHQFCPNPDHSMFHFRIGSIRYSFHLMGLDLFLFANFMIYQNLKIFKKSKFFKLPAHFPLKQTKELIQSLLLIQYPPLLTDL